MTNGERILELILRQPGLTDEQIRRKTGIEPHQQVNQICRKLATQGLVIRRPGREGLIVNLPGDPARSEEPVPAAPQVVMTASLVPRQAEGSIPAFDPNSTLIVLPCSARKVHPYGHWAGRAVLDLLPKSLAAELRTVRQANMTAVHLDESHLSAAADLYDGTLYRTGRDSTKSLNAAGATVVILSGGYGVVLADEPIGRYNQVFHPAMWPRRLIPRCLTAIAELIGATTIVGLLAGTSAYADVFRSTPWPRPAALVTPERVAGAQVKAPRALGEVLRVLAEASTLPVGWRSSDGLSMEVEVVSQ